HMNGTRCPRTRIWESLRTCMCKDIRVIVPHDKQFLIWIKGRRPHSFSRPIREQRGYRRKQHVVQRRLMILAVHAAVSRWQPTGVGDIPDIAVMLDLVVWFKYRAKTEANCKADCRNQDQRKTCPASVFIQHIISTVTRRSSAILT